MQSDSALTRYHRHIYRSLLNELSLLEKGKSREIARYERAHRRQLSRVASPSTWPDLLRAISRNSVILLGDFHTLRQSQKSALKILSLASERHPMALALECVHQKHQVLLDCFLAGEIDEDGLRHHLDFDRFWPFPWANYRELFLACRAGGIPLLALNIDNRPDAPNNLERRDQAAAAILNSYGTERPERKILALYGDLHLAKPGIPRHLKHRPLVVHQNEPRIYWSFRDKIDTGQAEVFRLGRTEFVLMNAVPWVKLQSHLDWLEGADPEAEGPAADALVRRFSDLARMLHLPAQEFPPVDVYLPDNGSSLRQLLRSGRVARAERRLLMHAMLFHRPVVLTEPRLAWVPNTGINTVAETAALLLHETLLGFPPSPRSSQPVFFLLMYRHALAYFGAKLLNPKRKCSELEDIESVLSAPLRRGEPKLRRHAFRTARRMLHWLLGQTSRKPRMESSRSQASLLEAARITGYLLGDRLFLASKQDSALLEKMSNLYRMRPIDEANAASALKRLATKHLKNLPHVKAKTEKL